RSTKWRSSKGAYKPDFGKSLMESRSSQRDLCCAKSAHPVNSASRWRRRRTYEKIWRAGLVGQRRRTQQELAHRHSSAADVAAEQVRVHLFQGGRCRHMAGQYAVAKAGCKTLNLRFEAVGHIEGGSVRHVA